jgi:hypothetical protein
MQILHYPNEKWFKPGKKDALPKEILDAYTLAIYNPDKELRGSHLIDTNSGRTWYLLIAIRAPIGWRDRLFPVEPDRKPVRQQRHERR